MKKLITYIGIGCLLCGCKASIFHKDGASRVVTSAVKPITKSLDDNADKGIKYLESLKINELVANIDKLTQSLKSNSDNVNKLIDKANSVDLDGVVSDSRKLITEITSTTTKLNLAIDKINADVKEVNKPSILAYVFGGIFILLTLVFMIYTLRKNKNEKTS